MKMENEKENKGSTTLPPKTGGPSNGKIGMFWVLQKPSFSTLPQRITPWGPPDDWPVGTGHRYAAHWALRTPGHEVWRVPVTS